MKELIDATSIRVSVRPNAFSITPPSAPVSESDATVPLTSRRESMTRREFFAEERTQQIEAPTSLGEFPPIELDKLALQRQKDALLAEMFGIVQEPTRLEHYEILGELGRGGMGVVYAAYDTKLDRKVAIKQLLARTSSTALRRRFISEAQAMAKLAHPNVVPIYEISEGVSGAYIAMEYIEGVTLRTWLEGDHSLPEQVAVLHDAGRGLAAAHAKGLVHRDFKPANVMVGEDGRVRVMDFGLARPDPQHAETGVLAPFSPSSTPAKSDLTHRGALIGTPAYMAPEQLRGQWADARSDQFAYCVTFYLALYGQRPFVAPSLPQLLQTIESGVLPEAPRHTTVPAWLRTLVIRGLHPDPGSRFASMEELLEALDAGEVLGALENEPPERVFVVHDGRDKLEVLRLCEGLLDRGLRPWLDIWDLVPGEALLEHGPKLLLETPAVLICEGPRELRGHLSPDPALEGALQARIAADPSSVYGVRLPGAPLRRSHAHEERDPIELEGRDWSLGLAELARRIGVAHERTTWLDDEAARMGLASAELSPYRGLEAFDEGEARWMFGRERETAELLALLGEGNKRFLTLVGASGSGKSSLVMAGLCPALRRGALAGSAWRIARLQPGERPCEALALALAELSPSASADPLALALLAGQLREQLLASPEAASRVLRYFEATEEDPKRRILLVVDQLEELFTETRLGQADASPEAMAFVRNLLHATGSEGRLWIVATLRADFVQRGLEIPELARALKSGTYFALPPMSEEQLRAAIVLPARRVGFELDPRLVERLINAAAGRAGQLPLLQHVLRELWLRRDEVGRVLPYEIYAETGGLEGAIAFAAERALEGLRARLGARALTLTRRVMTRLVHLGEGETGHTRHRVCTEELGLDSDTRLTIETFVRDARVLVGSELRGFEMLEIAHEALLREWSTLVGWLDADRDALRLRQELTRDANKRRELGDDEYLWGSGRVEEAQRVLGASTVDLNTSEREFLAASGRLARQHARQRKALVGALVVTGLLAGGLVLQNGCAETEAAKEQVQTVEQQKLATEEQRAAAERRQTDAEEGELDAEKSALAAKAALALTMIDTNNELETLLLMLEPIGEFLESWPEVQVPDPVRDAFARVLAEDAILVHPSVLIEGHEGSIRSLALSPDGKWAASGGGDGAVRLWSLAGGSSQVLTGPDARPGYVMSVEFSPDSTRLLSASLAGFAEIWEVESGRLLATLEGHEAGVLMARYSPNGSQIATASQDGTLRLWSVQGELQMTLTGHRQTVFALDYAPDGRTLASASFDTDVRLWSAETGAPLARLQGHEGQVYDVEYAPDGETLASASHDGSVRIWDPSTGAERHVLGEGQRIKAVSYSPDSSQLVAGGREGVARVWDVDSGDLISTLTGHEARITALAYAADGSYIATASADTTIELWDPGTGMQLATLAGHREGLFALAISSSGERLVSGGRDAKLGLWAPSHERLSKDAGHTGFIYGLDASPDGLEIATSSHDGLVKLWDTETGELRRTLRGHESYVNALAYAPVGMPRLASADDQGIVRLWNPATGETLAEIDAHTRSISALRFTLDGTRIVTAGGDALVKVWDASDGTPSEVFAGHDKAIQALRLSPDGKHLASASLDTTTRIWDLSGEEAAVTLIGHEGYVNGLAYSPDGARIVTASADKTVRIWDPETGVELETCTGHKQQVYALAYAPDGHSFASAGNDGSVRLWDTDCSETLAVLDGHSDTINALIYSSDGTLLASGSEDASVRVWDAQSRAPDPLAIFIGHEGPVTDILLSGQDSRLVSVSEDHRGMIWELGDAFGVLSEAFTLEDRIGYRCPDGSLVSELSVELLVCMGCARLDLLDGVGSSVCPEPPAQRCEDLLDAHACEAEPTSVGESSL